MIDFKLQRFHDTGDATLGILTRFQIEPPQKPAYSFLCFTLEDTYRAKKIPGKTRIPAGRYELRFKPIGESKFDTQYAALFPFHRGMIRLQDVPGFSEILIHCGNTSADTEGCILVGESSDRAGTVGRSRAAYAPVYQALADAIHHGPTFLTITDEGQS